MRRMRSENIKVPRHSYGKRTIWPELRHPIQPEKQLPTRWRSVEGEKGETILHPNILRFNHASLRDDFAVRLYEAYTEMAECLFHRKEHWIQAMLRISGFRIPCPRFERRE